MCLTVSMRKPSKSATSIQYSNDRISASFVSGLSVLRSLRPPGKSPFVS